MEKQPETNTNADPSASGQAQGNLTPKQQKAVTTINNAVDDHLQPKDISGATADQMGSPIWSNIKSRYFDHTDEVGTNLGSVRKNADILQGVIHPDAQAAVQKAQTAIKDA